jgi:hypothetical protein
LRVENLTFVPNGTAFFNEPFRILGRFSTGLVVRNVSISGAHDSGFQIIGPINGQTGSTTNVLFENTLVKGTFNNGYLVRADRSTDDPNGGMRDITFRNARAIGNVSENKPFGDESEVDGFAISHGNPPAVSNVVFDHTLAADNAEDGYDVAGDVKLLDVRATGNGSAGIRVFCNAQIENAHIARNWGSGVRTVGPEPDDGSRPTVDILGCTLAHNASRGGSEVSLASKRSRVRMYNNILAGDVTEFSGETGVIDPEQGRLGLQYNKQQDLQLEWDHNLFWRDTTCSPTQSCGAAIRFTDGAGATVTCEGTSTGVKNCDGSHASSEYGEPAFESTGLRYLAPSSAGIDGGLSQPTFLNILPDTERAHLFDRDGHPRPKGLRNDIGAFEGSSCIGDCDSDEQVEVSELVKGVNIALGGTPAIECDPLDDNASNTVVIAEVLDGVGNAMDRCPDEGTASVGDGGGASAGPVEVSLDIFDSEGLRGTTPGFAITSAHAIDLAGVNFDLLYPAGVITEPTCALDSHIPAPPPSSCRPPLCPAGFSLRRQSVEPGRLRLIVLMEPLAYPRRPSARASS